mmetsp:Transcript_36603/g.72922  ORF Transcript_36603/g.72922 Transcript_36603/m.72922 type:complete len:264 (+) Transcript_36603:336-1127(+)
MQVTPPRVTLRLACHPSAPPHAATARSGAREERAGTAPERAGAHGAGPISRVPSTPPPLPREHLQAGAVLIDPRSLRRVRTPRTCRNPPSPSPSTSHPPPLRRTARPLRCPDACLLHCPASPSSLSSSSLTRWWVHTQASHTLPSTLVLHLPATPSGGLALVSDIRTRVLHPHSDPQTSPSRPRPPVRLCLLLSLVGLNKPHLIYPLGRSIVVVRGLGLRGDDDVLGEARQVRLELQQTDTVIAHRHVARNLSKLHPASPRLR